jgi:phosphatidylserine/phosphatidylglycerophosphate/cardiolipin synthase-like enzyme
MQILRPKSGLRMTRLRGRFPQLGKPGPTSQRTRQRLPKVTMEIKFARTESVADVITGLMHQAAATIEGALYRFNHPGLAQALEEAVHRGVRVRLVVDANKYKESRTTQELLAGAIIPFRLAFGRQGRGSKMHHKFVILDQQTVLTGSYNWTLESEDENHENLLVLRDPQAVEAYTHEFEALWSGAGRADS